MFRHQDQQAGDWRSPESPRRQDLCSRLYGVDEPTTTELVSLTRGAGTRLVD